MRSFIFTNLEKSVCDIRWFARSISIHRSQIIRSSISEVNKEYNSSALGRVWLILLPIIQLSVYVLLYGFIFRVRPAEINTLEYLLFLFSGISLLFIFSESLTAGASSLDSNKSLLENTVFPAHLLPVRAVLIKSVHGIIVLFISIVFAILIGKITVLAVFIPLILFLLLCFSIGLSLILSLFSLLSKDILVILPIILQLIFILSPFAYTPSMVPPVLKFLLYLNPMSFYVQSIQTILVFQVSPSSFTWLGMSLSSGLSLILGIRLFRKLKPSFIDFL